VVIGSSKKVSPISAVGLGLMPCASFLCRAMGESDSSSASGLGLGDVSLHVIEPNRRAEDLHVENLLVVQGMHQSSSCLHSR
jgi:hypothetical protein